MARPPTTLIRPPTAITQVSPGTVALGAPGYVPGARQAFQATFDAGGTAIWKATGTPLYNVREFGAVGDGVTDDTAALHAAVAAVTSEGNATSGRKFGLYLPAGVYATTDVVFIQSIGFYMCGDGPWQSVIMLTSGAPVAVLEIISLFGTFRDFGVWAQAPALPTRLIYVHGDPGPCTTNLFHNIYGRGEWAEAGFRIGKPGSTAQCDQTVLSFVSMVGGMSYPGRAQSTPAAKWRAGFYFGSDISGNNLAHAAYWIQAASCQRGVEVSATQVQITGGLAENNQVDFYGAGSGYYTFSGIRSELSSEFFVQPDVGGVAAPLTVRIQDCVVEGPQSTPTFQWLGTVAAAGAATLQDTVGGWVANQWIGYEVLIRSGNAGPQNGNWFTYQTGDVVSNTSDTLTVTVPWGIVPSAGSTYVLMPRATGGDATHVQLLGAGWTPDALVGSVVYFLSGLLQGITPVEITANTTDTLTLATPVPFAPTGAAFTVTNIGDGGTWLSCTMPGNYQIDGVMYAGTNQRWALGSPPVMHIAGTARPAQWSITKLSVMGAAPEEAIVTDFRTAYTVSGYQELDVNGDVVATPFGPPDGAHEGTLDVVSAIGVRFARPDTLGPGAPYAASIAGGDATTELVVTGDVRADGGTRVATTTGGAGVKPLPASTTYVRLTGSGGSFTLPAAAAAGAGVSIVYVVVDFTGAIGGAPVTFVPDGTETINGVNAPFSFATNWGRLRLTSDGVSAWSAQ